MYRYKQVTNIKIEKWSKLKFKAFRKKAYVNIQDIRKQQIANKNRYEIRTMELLNEMGLRYEYRLIYGPYVLDFYLPDYRVDLEMDGHYHKRRRTQDRKRTRYLHKKRIYTVRYWNSALMDAAKFKQALLNRLTRFKKIEPEPRPLDSLTMEYQSVVA